MDEDPDGGTIFSLSEKFEVQRDDTAEPTHRFITECHLQVMECDELVVISQKCFFFSDKPLVSC